MTHASLKGFIKVGNIIFSSRFLHCDLSPSNPARSRRGPTGCRVLVKRCNPKIMSDYGTLSLTSRDSAVTPLTEKKPLPMPPAIFGFIDVLNTSLPQEKAKHQVNRRTHEDMGVKGRTLGYFFHSKISRFLKQTARTIKLRINPHFFSTGNKNADTMIQKVQKETTTKE